jgi:ATP-binding cassette, subfamily C, type I secretion system permease/ATPase
VPTTKPAPIRLRVASCQLYTLEIYNRILPSHSEVALALLTLAMVVLHATSGILDFFRARLLGEAALRLDPALSARVFAYHLNPGCADDQSLRDLDQMRAFLSGPAPAVVFDVPWLPVYLGAISLLHPLLGVFATGAAGLMLGLTLAAERGRGAHAARTARARWSFASSSRGAAAVAPMALESGLHQRWTTLNRRHLQAQSLAARHASALSAAVKAVRPALQSGILGTGAFLVIDGKMAAGAIFAASIILSRALAPLEMAAAHWRSLALVRRCHARLSAELGAREQHAPPSASRSQPNKSLVVERLSVSVRGRADPVLRDVNFELQAGDGLAIIGPTRLREVHARRRPETWAGHGAVRLDGVALAAWSPTELGTHIGYLPHDIRLIDGSIADNISHFEESAVGEKVVAAARAAGVNGLIELLPLGYLTQINGMHEALPPALLRGIALARALYGDPFLVVLDAADASLDAEGDARLAGAIATVRRRGGIVVVVANRRRALAAVENVLALADGRVAAFGRKEEVLNAVLRQSPAPGVRLQRTVTQ